MYVTILINIHFNLHKGIDAHKYRHALTSEVSHILHGFLTISSNDII